MADVTSSENTDHERVRLRKLSDAEGAHPNVHLARSGVVPYDLLDVVRAIKRGGVRRLVAVPLRAARAANNQVQIVLQALAGWVRPDQRDFERSGSHGHGDGKVLLLTGVERAGLVLDYQLLVGAVGANDRGAQSATNAPPYAALGMFGTTPASLGMYCPPIL